jgi:hypothetical protein
LKGVLTVDSICAHARNIRVRIPPCCNAVTRYPGYPAGPGDEPETVIPCDE